MKGYRHAGSGCHHSIQVKLLDLHRADDDRPVCHDCKKQYSKPQLNVPNAPTLCGMDSIPLVYEKIKLSYKTRV